MSRYVFLDRDGTINVNVVGGVCQRKDFQLLPGVGKAIARLNRVGFQLIVITNQANIDRGSLTWPELTAIHDDMQARLAEDGARIRDIYVCPHAAARDCACRKPKPLLLLEAARQHQIHLPSTYFVGDSSIDNMAAIAAGCNPIRVRSGEPIPDCFVNSCPIFDDLGGFTDWHLRARLDS